MYDPMTTPNKVREHAKQCGLACSDLITAGRNVKQAWLSIGGTNISPVEVYFHRPADDKPWQWHTAIHRVHHSDPISRLNGGQPELTTYQAFKAYLALLSVALEDRPLASERKPR